MKLKALCGIFYNGVLYSHGDVFEAPRVMANTSIVHNDNSEGMPPENFKGTKSEKKSGKRGDRNA